MEIARSTDHDKPAISIDDTALVETIVAVSDSFEAHGYRRMQATLHHRGFVVNHKKIRRLMREHELQRADADVLIDVERCPREVLDQRRRLTLLPRCEPAGRARQHTATCGPCGARNRMKGVDTIARVRRELYMRGRSIKEIYRELHVSRNTVRKILRGRETAFADEQTVQLQPKNGRWREELDRLPAVNASREAGSG